MRSEYIKITSRMLPFLRIISFGVAFAFLYFASSVVVTLLLAVLLSYFLEPAVDRLQRVHIPRGLGALVVLLVVTLSIGVLGYLAAARARQFSADWPRYSAVLRRVTTAVDRKLASVESEVKAIGPEQGNREDPRVVVAETRSVNQWLLLGVGSLYSVFLVATFLPFLVFFMLAAKPQIWKATMELFPSESRTRVKDALDELNAMLRSYLAGNALVALILMLASSAVFLALHLEYPFLVGAVSGLLNLVPYMGAVLACVPPILVGLVKWSTIGPFLGIALTVFVLHFIGGNLLLPAIVGRRVHLNPLAVTMGLLLWGWLWGAIGIILAIPITAAIKVICDHVEGWESVGRWLGA